MSSNLNDYNFYVSNVERQPRLKSGAIIDNPDFPNTPLFEEEKPLQTSGDTTTAFTVSLAKSEIEAGLGNLLKLIDSVKQDFQHYDVNVVDKLWGFVLSIMERTMFDNPIVLEDSADLYFHVLNTINNGVITHHIQVPIQYEKSDNPIQVLIDGPTDTRGFRATNSYNQLPGESGGG